MIIRKFMISYTEFPKALFWDLHYFYYTVLLTTFPQPYKRSQDLLLNADDTALLISNSSFSKMESLAASELSRVYRWVTSNGLTLYPNKTNFCAKYFLFSRKLCLFDLSSLTLNNVKIEMPKVTKYLGILIDDKLSFKSHIESKLSRSVGI